MPESRRRWLPNSMSSIAEEEARLMGDDQASLDDDYNPRKKFGQHQRRKLYLALIYSGIGFICILLVASIFASLRSHKSYPNPKSGCQDPHKGYICHPDLSHSWGQYSPYYLVPSLNIPTSIPKTCHLTSLHLLSRHGARFPTLDKSALYAQTIGKIKSRVSISSLTGPYAFLANYSFDLGADSLTGFGRQQMIDSGSDFFTQYSKLAKKHTPFIRASGQERVIESAQKFAEGFHTARIAASGDDDENNDPEYPYPTLTIPETPGQNNTLSHNQCPAFESSNTGQIAQTTFTQTWLPAIHTRLTHDLPTANLTLRDTLSLMDLCPFETVASNNGDSISPFCELSTEDEWVRYDYHQTLGKFYGPGAGSPLGPTQGVGWVNELIARLTDHPVKDSTSTNRTLDGSEETFPLGKGIYADFSHDNDMMSIFAAMGLYAGMPGMETGRVMGESEMGGFGAAKMVPFAGRMAVEGMSCESEGEMVRVVMNGRVLPLEMCGGDGEGRCSLEAFVEGLAFARRGGKWGECFQDEDVRDVAGQEVLGRPG